MLTEAYRLHYKEVSVKIATLKSQKEIGEGLWVFCQLYWVRKRYTLERIELVLSFLMFKTMKILVLKWSMFWKATVFCLMPLMRLLVAFSFTFE